ncbi:MAG TPA: hypothetical protein VL501_08360 [Pyrinomonadaceae bacterium]|nr:hypothetical protein [Pyrinomonadaceae bacterium]
MLKFALVLSMLFVCGAGAAFAQADKQFPPDDRRSKQEDEHPFGFQESLSKMRIAKEKKEFDEMLKRGDDAVTIAEHLDENAPVSSQRGKISEIGKLVKKIRDELGGDGDDDDSVPAKATDADAIKLLKEKMSGLSEELKKVDRFTVSAAAIDRANDILKLVKYLRG